MPTGAMIPTVKENGYVIADTSAVRPSDINRWDMIVFRSPDTVRVYGKKPEDLPLYVTRIIGLPGETIEFAGPEILVNGTSLQRLDGQVGISYSGLAAFPPGTRKLEGPAEVKLGNSEYFYMGDRTASAIDSRFLGPLPIGNIVGKVLRVE
jgi:signal peptidase I